jgi:hypothetical protein
MLTQTCKHSPLSSGFTLLEAIISAGLISVALMSSFAIIKVLSSSRSVILERASYQRISDDLSGQYRLTLQGIQSTELQSLAVVNNVLPLLSSVNCPSSGGLTLALQMQSALCSVKYPDGMKVYTITISNTLAEPIVNDIRHMRIKVSFYDPANMTTPTYERISYMLK